MFKERAIEIERKGEADRSAATMEWKQLEYQQHPDPVETTICLSAQILRLQTGGSGSCHGSRFCLSHMCCMW